MKITLLVLTLTLTTLISNTQTSEKLTAGQSIEILTNNQIIIREMRSAREIRQNRKIRAERVIKMETAENITASPMARNSRELRKNRFIVQRKSRKIRHLFVQDNLNIARLN